MPEKAKIVLFNKPYKVMSQFSRPEGSGKSTLADFIELKDVYPAGRLDYDSEGLLVLTDNGILQDQIAHPSNGKQKTYWVQVEGEIDRIALSKLQNGVTLKDGLTKPAKAVKIAEPEIWPRNPPIRSRKDIPTSWLSLTISEGKNRQVRRMTAAVGHPTLRLIRANVGEWSVKQLAPGEYAVLEVDSPPPKQRRPKTVPNKTSYNKSPAKRHSATRKRLAKPPTRPKR